MHVASHAQKYIKHLKDITKEKRRETILDIISTHAEAAGTSQVVLSTMNERTLPQESINAKQTVAVAEGESTGHCSLVQKKMSTDRTCNSSFWTKEEGKIKEKTLAVYSRDKDLFTKMEEALLGKSRDDIINHYNILIEDVEPIDSRRVPLPYYPKVHSDSGQNSRGGVILVGNNVTCQIVGKATVQSKMLHGEGGFLKVSRGGLGVTKARKSETLYTLLGSTSTCVATISISDGD
ncbi:hypothetical protein CQW23_21306 [Capsicum baccatum]|uniref:Myb-like domain-containing protein n=1 Tax=Capsicum baccatum TaxID=33114 RepID=A0A2G2VXR7_CAPBA|nr:hypothetical protein CQW23_21306 [Capsicum baccatum]